MRERKVGRKVRGRKEKERKVSEGKESEANTNYRHLKCYCSLQMVR